MGIRSDVGIAVKKGIVFSDATQKMLETADERRENDEGTLYVFNNNKWYTDGYPELIQLYAELDELNEDDFLVLEACSEYPTTEDSNRGEWRDNPWGLSVSVRVDLNYD